jgi:hypothetical protein
MKYKCKTTERGFKLIQFKDSNGAVCDIQESSRVEPHIWLGTDEPAAKILASKTEQGGTGWVDYQLPKDVLINNRMHLSQKRCLSLGFKLLKYGLTGRL